MIGIIFHCVHIYLAITGYLLYPAYPTFIFLISGLKSLYPNSPCIRQISTSVDSQSINLRQCTRKISFFRRKFRREGPHSHPYSHINSSALRYLSCDEHLISLRRSRLNKSGKTSLSIVRSVGATSRLQYLPSGTGRW